MSSWMLISASVAAPRFLPFDAIVGPSTECDELAMVELRDDVVVLSGRANAQSVQIATYHEQWSVLSSGYDAKRAMRDICSSWHGRSKRRG